MGYDVSAFLGDGAIELDGIPSPSYPRGKTYRFPSPTAERGLWMRNLFEFGVKVNLGITPGAGEAAGLNLNDDQELDLYREVMGDTLDEMLTDGVLWAHVQGVFGLLLRKHGQGMDVDVSISRAAESARGEGQARPNRATRRTAPKTDGSKSNRESSPTKARTRARTSTRSSETPDAAKATRLTA